MKEFVRPMFATLGDLLESRTWQHQLHLHSFSLKELDEEEMEWPIWLEGQVINLRVI